MTQLSLDFPPLVTISLFCKLDLKLARWDTHAQDVTDVLQQCTAEVAKHKGTHGTVLALIRTPVDNTQTS